jgi:hypothetical protein
VDDPNFCSIYIGGDFGMNTKTLVFATGLILAMFFLGILIGLIRIFLIITLPIYILYLLIYKISFVEWKPRILEHVSYDIIIPLDNIISKGNINE